MALPDQFHVVALQLATDALIEEVGVLAGVLGGDAPVAGRGHAAADGDGHLVVLGHHAGQFLHLSNVQLVVVVHLGNVMDGN